MYHRIYEYDAWYDKLYCDTMILFKWNIFLNANITLCNSVRFVGSFEAIVYILMNYVYLEDILLQCSGGVLEEARRVIQSGGTVFSLFSVFSSYVIKLEKMASDIPWVHYDFEIIIVSFMENSPQKY